MAGPVLDRRIGAGSVPSTYDVQSGPDRRRVAIDRVGVRALRHPLVFEDRDGGSQCTVAEARMYVGLPHDQRGAHLSRFLEVLHQRSDRLSVVCFGELLDAVAARLDAERTVVELEFPYFVVKRAPISGRQSVMDYRIALSGRGSGRDQRRALRVVVPATNASLSSRQGSDRGAHNQRVQIALTVESSEPIWAIDLIELAERNASSELFGILKRSDEKVVTERAYETPKLLEDLARDLAAELSGDARIEGFVVEVESEESVHNYGGYVAVQSAGYRPL